MQLPGDLVTISGMVGYLEGRWPATAVIVVAIIAPAAFYALAPVKPPRAVEARRSTLGRLYLRSGDPKPPLTRYDAWVVLGVSVLAAVIAPLLIDWFAGAQGTLSFRGTYVSQTNAVAISFKGRITY